MGFSCRVLLVDQNDDLYRLANWQTRNLGRCSEIQQATARHVSPGRECAADTIVELVRRVPNRIIRITFDILTLTTKDT